MKVIIHNSDGTERITDHYNDVEAIRYILEQHKGASYTTNGFVWHVWYLNK